MLSLSVFVAYLFSCAFLCSFIVLNVRDSEPVDVFRILSGAAAIVTQALAAFSSAGKLPLEDVACSLILADAIMLMAPSRHESGVASIVLCSVMTFAFFLMPFVHLMRWGVLFPVIVIPVLLDIEGQAEVFSRSCAIPARAGRVQYNRLFVPILLRAANV